MHGWSSRSLQRPELTLGAHAGRDPKPFPPPMKICREMVDAMGGFDSEMYRRFRTLACEAYNLLRKHSKLLLSLCHLMAGAAIPDMHADPEKALLKVQASADITPVQSGHAHSCMHQASMWQLPDRIC